MSQATQDEHLAHSDYITCVSVATGRSGPFTDSLSWGQHSPESTLATSISDRSFSVELETDGYLIRQLAGQLVTHDSDFLFRGTFATILPGEWSRDDGTKKNVAVKLIRKDPWIHPEIVETKEEEIQVRNVYVSSIARWSDRSAAV